MKIIKFKTKISRMGNKGLIMNVPKSIEHLFYAGDNIVFYKEVKNE